MSAFVLYLHAASTLSMVGLIWFVQVVHYPLFARVEQGFIAYEQIHQQRTTWVVAPLMPVSYTHLTLPTICSV